MRKNKKVTKWQIIINFTKIKRGGINIRQILKLL